MRPNKTEIINESKIIVVEKGQIIFNYHYTDIEDIMTIYQHNLFNLIYT